MTVLMRSTLARLVACVLLTLLAAPLPRAWGQCGSAVTARLGGEVGALAQINISTLAVGRGSTIELVDISNTTLPAWFSPRRVVGIDAPAKKLAYAAGSTRLFAMMEDGNVAVIPLSFAGAVTMGTPFTIDSGAAVDIVADGTRVYIATLIEDSYNNYISSHIIIYETASGTATLIRWISPFIDNYGFDRIVKIGNTLWAGIHDFESSLFGVEAYNVSNPAAPVRVTTSLNNAPLGSFTRVSAMHAIGTRLLLSYLYVTPSQFAEDWMRAVEVGTPTNPVWYAPVDLNGYAGCMTSVGNLLRISIEGSGIGTWDTSNPNALSWLGAYFNSYPQVGQMIAIGAIDYWAAGRGGLMTMLTANPAAITALANLTPLPIGPSVVRQAGNTTVVLDYTLNTLRIFDYTLPESQQLRSSVSLPFYSELVELGVGAAGVQTLACVATKRPGTNDTITVYDITNPAAPFVRATISNVEPHLMAVVNSRLYVMTTTSEFRIYELSQQPPQLRSSTPFGGQRSDYTCLTGWEAGATKAVALGTNPFGLWIINVTDAINPLVSSIWNPVSNYRVHAVAKGNNYLYISARIEGELPSSNVGSRLESLTVTNLANPVSRFVVDHDSGAGSQGIFEGLSYISAPTGKFLIGTRPDNWDGPLGAQAVIYELPPGFLTNEGVPFPLSVHTLPYATGRAVPNSNGSRFLLSGGPAGLYELNTPVQWAPGYGIQNFNHAACYNATVQFFAFSSANPTNTTVQWWRYGPSTPNASWTHTPLTDGPTGWGSSITGSTEFAMTLSNAHPYDRKFSYYMIATNSCGPTSSYYSTISMCPSDFNCSGSTTVQDIFDFLTAYFAGNASADFNGVGGVSVQDIFDFITAYFSFCY